MKMTKYLSGVFLKVDDVRGEPIRAKIIDVTEGRYDKPNLTFDDGNILSLNTTNIRTLVRAYGMESDDLIGKEVELKLGEIQYQGKPQEAILVVPISRAIEDKAPAKKPGFDDTIPF